jgi:beta-lactamase class A
MKTFRCLWSTVLALAWPALSHAADPKPILPMRTEAQVQSIVDAAVQATLAEFAEQKLQPKQLAVTLMDLRDPARPLRGSHRGDERIYPASVVKLFYLVAAHRQMEDKTLEDTAELRRALSDMIVLSYNEATHYVLDLLTGTTSGPELEPEALKAWHHQRGAVNRYFASLGYTNINADKKPWGEGPYGRETQAMRAFKPSRNELTTDATARLLAEIATGKAVSAKRCEEMLALMKRDFAQPTGDPDSQAHGFTAPGLPADAKLWSKAGWTSQTRHDAAYVELANGERFVLVTFTVGHANNRAIIPSVARAVVKSLGGKG